MNNNWVPDALGIVRLSPGEYEGPFIIDRPCTIVGNNTTLWSRDQTIIEVRSKGVKIKDLSIEITADNLSCAVSTKSNDTFVENVCIHGEVQGFGAEDNEWDIPNVLNIRDITADKGISFCFEIFVPTKTKISTSISGVKISPTQVNPGKNIIKVEAGALTENTVLFGSIEFTSLFIRKTYLSITAKRGGKDITGQCVYNTSVNAKSLPKIANIENSVKQNVSSVIKSLSSNKNELIRGQRVNASDIVDNHFTITYHQDSASGNIEVDAYIFMLDKSGRANSDSNLVFFGQKKSVDGSIFYIDENKQKICDIDLTRISAEYESVAVTFAIYGDNPSNNFSKVKNPYIKIESTKGSYIFRLDGLVTVSTVVALEFYRKGENSWKINMIGRGYKDGIKRLCESYGLIVV